jgi:hypothetical protein
MRGAIGQAVCALFIALPVLAQQPRTGVVKGTIYDSVTATPLAGALMQMISKSEKSLTYWATADSTGGFRATNVQAGEYLIGFQTDVLAGYGVADLPLRSVRVEPGETVLAPLAVPSGETLMRAHCGVVPRRDSLGAMSGHVLDAESGLPVAGAKIIVTWTEAILTRKGLSPISRRTVAMSDAAGFFVACGVPAGEELTFSADAGPRRSGSVLLEVPPMGLSHRDLAVTDTTGIAPQAGRAAGGRATLFGIVRDTRGRPMPGAIVRVADAGREVRTSENGAFQLDSLPSGSREVEVVLLGFSPAMRAVDLSAQRPATATITIDRNAATLSEVKVKAQAKSIHDSDLRGFLDRKRTNGFGIFIGVDKIEDMRPIVTTDLLRSIAGVTVTESRSLATGNMVRMRSSIGGGGCTPVVWVDNIPLPAGLGIDQYINPFWIQGIEVYKDWTAVPAQFSAGAAGSTCGAIVVWTKR